MVRETRAKHENLIHEEFMEPKDKRPSLTAESDAAYETMLKSYNERFEGSQEKGYLEDHKEGLYQNYYNYIAGYVKSHSGHRYSADPRFSILLRNA